MLSVFCYSMSRLWRNAITDEAKEKEKVRREGKKTEQGQGTQELPHFSQDEQSPSSSVNELIRKVLDEKEEDEPQMQPLSPLQEVFLTDHSYPRYQSGPQELPQHQPVNTQM
jgi:hypothetical protein